jgi:hypothetical protein
MGQNESTNNNVVVLDSKDLLAFSKNKNAPNRDILRNIIEDTPVETQNSNNEERKDNNENDKARKKDKSNDFNIKKSKKSFNTNGNNNNNESFSSINDKSEKNENLDKNTVNNKSQYLNNNNSQINKNNKKGNYNLDSIDQITPDNFNDITNKSKVKLKNKNPQYIKSFLDKSRSAFLELNLKDIQEGKDAKEGKHNALNFDNFDLFVHEKDPETSEIIFDNEINKLKNTINKEFEYINFTITGEKKFKFPESRLETLSLIRTQFLLVGQNSDRQRSSIFQRRETRTIGLKNNDSKIFSSTVKWGENNTEKGFKNDLEKLDLEQRLMNQYRSEMLDVSDPSFINKFAIIMHKYENVSFKNIYINKILINININRELLNYAMTLKKVMSKDNLIILTIYNLKNYFNCFLFN